MAFYDWNHNGKKDIQDDYLEYNIYKKSTENNQNNSYNSYPKKSSNTWGTVGAAAFVIAFLYLFAWFGNTFGGNNKCMEIGCLEKRKSRDTLYCSEHYMEHLKDKYK